MIVGPPAYLAQSGGVVIHGALILILCVAAGVGTILLLPSRLETSFRKIGGAVVLLAAVGGAVVVNR